MATCSVDGCLKLLRSKGMCEKHYYRDYRYGNPHYSKLNRKPDKSSRLVYRYTITNYQCWEWIGSRNSCGYGTLSYMGVPQLAHRLAYEAWVGPIPAGLSVCHTCDNPSCINPEHLWVGTHQDNMIDRQNKGRNRGVEVAAARKRSRL